MVGYFCIFVLRMAWDLLPIKKILGILVVTITSMKHAAYLTSFVLALLGVTFHIIQGSYFLFRISAEASWSIMVIPIIAFGLFTVYRLQENIQLIPANENAFRVIQWLRANVSKVNRGRLALAGVYLSIGLLFIPYFIEMMYYLTLMGVYALVAIMYLWIQKDFLDKQVEQKEA